MNFYTALVWKNWGQTFTEYFRFGACSQEEIVSAKLFMNYGAVERLHGGKNWTEILEIFKETKIYYFDILITLFY